MVSASKAMFDRATAGATCRELIHPWTTSCVNGSFTILWDSMKGAYKFYAILYLVQMIIKYKKINREYFLKQFKLYIMSGAFGFSVGTSFVTINCLLSRFVFTKFHYYTTVFLPCAIGGAGILLEPPHRRYLVISTFFNLVLEFWVRELEFKGFLKRTPLRETFLFMMGSSYLFYLMRQERDKPKRMSLLWFFTPPQVNRQPASTNGYVTNESVKQPNYCPHTERCQDYILKGTVQMFGLGCAMSLLRHLIPRLGSPMKALRSITRRHFSLGLFFGGYIGIYRLVTCILTRHHKRDSAKHALPAGFLAGSAFWFNPNLSISLASVTSILHILCSRMYEKKMLPENIPLPELLFAFCQGLLYHARIMHPDTCPRYIVNLLSTVTSGKVDMVYKFFLQMLQSC